jgi:hypothetical protein
MAKKDRIWFFNVPNTSAHKRFRQRNLPDETCFRNLTDSIAMFNETSDTAKESEQGLVKLATDVNVITRTSVSLSTKAKQTVVRPHQLPLMVGASDTEATTINTALEEEDGIKLTPVYNSGSTRMNFKIEFVPILLNGGVEGIPDIDADKSFSLADKIIFLDYSDGNKPKLTNISYLIAGASFWSRSGTILEPKTANDDVDIGRGTFLGENITLNSNFDSVIKLNDQTSPGTGGSKLTLKSSDSAIAAGGNLVLKGGTSSIALDGGSVHIYGGNSSGANQGNVFLGYSEGSVAIGKIGVLGTIESGYDITLRTPTHGKMFIDGDLNVAVTLATLKNTILGLDSNNNIVKNTNIQTKDWLFGTGSKGDILIHDGTEFIRLAAPGAVAYIKTDGVGNLSWDTTLTSADKYVAVDAAATPGYLYDGGAGVLRLDIHGGFKITDHGDYISLGIYTESAEEIVIDFDLSGSELSTESFILGEDLSLPTGNTKRYNLGYYIAGLSHSGWLELNADDEYNNTASSTSRIAMYDDFTGILNKGMPIKFKLTSAVTIYYAIITDVQATYIDIAGAPLTTGANDIDNLWVGSPNKVITKELILNVANYNVRDTASGLTDLMNIKGGYKWHHKDAFCVHFTAIHVANDSTVQPNVNLRVGLAASTTDYLSTSNANEGITVGTGYNQTIVDIDPAKYSIGYGENIEAKIFQKGTGDADYLTICATFVLK